MANRNEIRFDRTHAITVGRTYTMNNGWTAKVDAIWCDKYGDNVRYTTNDGKCGDTSPNSFYYWVDWNHRVAA